MMDESSRMNQIILEGNTKLFLPYLARSNGPATSDMQVFYNPVMSLNRDFSVLFFHHAQGIRRALDGLAATGARGIRIMNETTYSEEMHINDHSPSALEVIERNAALNDVHVITHRENLNTLLSRGFYDYIDIDPFGSPVEFVPMAFRSVRNHGYLAVTATDTGALCGSYPKPGLRRYGFRNRRNPLTHETGLRGLIGYLVHQAASCDRYVEPLLSQSINHYYRVLLRVHNGAKKADTMIQALRELRLTDAGFTLQEPGYPPGDSNSGSLGPFYTGNLHDPYLIRNMAAAIPLVPIQNSKKVEKLLGLYKGEVNSEPFFYDTDRISSFLKRSSPPLSAVLESLTSQGYSAAPTQFLPTGFKTNADEKTVIGIMSILQPKS